MKFPAYSAVPRFSIGEGVVVLTPGADKGKEGVISEVVNHTGDFVYRYDVLLTDGKSKRFFGFEIELSARRSA